MVLANWETWSHSVCTVGSSTSEIITSTPLAHTSCRRLEIITKDKKKPTNYGLKQGQGSKKHGWKRKLQQEPQNTQSTHSIWSPPQKKAFKNRGETITYLLKGAGTLEFPAVL